MLERAAAGLSLRSRRRKLRLFMEHLAPTEETAVVDVGVADTPFGEGEGQALTHNFFEALYPWPHRITAVGDVPLPHFAEAFPEIRYIVADGRRLPFADSEFDVGFSNAVVEHVGPEVDDQRRFVHELCRVSRSVFVTTPNRLFPIDPHTLLPAAHWLPERAREGIFARLRKDEARGLRPLTPWAFRALFPYPVRLVAAGATLVAVGGEVLTRPRAPA